MKALSFIRNFGWERAKEIKSALRGTASLNQIIDPKNHHLIYLIHSDEVDFLEFRDDLESYISAYEFLESNKINPYINFSGDFSIEIEQAVALVEEVGNV